MAFYDDYFNNYFMVLLFRFSYTAEGFALFYYIMNYCLQMGEMYIILL